MLLRALRLATILLTALSMSFALCHLYEMPAKLRLTGAEWVTLLHTLYPPTFGTIGAACEVGAVAGTLALAFAIRQRAVVRWTLTAVVLLVVVHSIFWIWIAPVNATLGPADPHALPSGWEALRARWEYAHAARALLQVAALAALVWSVLLETPDTQR